MTPERTELIVNLNLLPEPSGEFMLKHLNDFSTPLPRGLCEERYTQRVHVLGLLIQQYTPQRLLDGYQNNKGAPFSKFGITDNGMACIRFKAAWPERDSVFVGFVDKLTAVDINALLNDEKRMLCYLGQGATSDTFFQQGKETEPITREEFITFAESVIASIIAITAEHSEPARRSRLGGYGDMSWLSILSQNGVQFHAREENP